LCVVLTKKSFSQKHNNIFNTLFHILLCFSLNDFLVINRTIKNILLITAVILSEFLGPDKQPQIFECPVAVR
jgi:hypothetical protein